jgi:hypothetical protein
MPARIQRVIKLVILMDAEIHVALFVNVDDHQPDIAVS